MRGACWIPPLDEGFCVSLPLWELPAEPCTPAASPKASTFLPRSPILVAGCEGVCGSQAEDVLPAGLLPGPDIPAPSPLIFLWIPANTVGPTSPRSQGCRTWRKLGVAPSDVAATAPPGCWGWRCGGFRLRSAACARDPADGVQDKECQISHWSHLYGLCIEMIVF